MTTGRQAGAGAIGVAILGALGAALLSRSGEAGPARAPAGGTIGDAGRAARQIASQGRIAARSVAETLPTSRQLRDLAPAIRAPRIALPGLPKRTARTLPFLRAPGVPRTTAVKAARRLNRAAGTLAVSVLFDSAVEHYRGSFHNKAMFAPLISATLSLVASAHGVADKRPVAHDARDAVYGLAGAVGLIGTGFHLYNIGKREGGYSWLNLFYAAPIGAPAALSLSGMLGFLAERVRNNRPGAEPKVLGLPAGRAVAALTSAGIAGTVGEVGLLHFRGAYHDPAMFLPVSVPPVAAALLANSAMGAAGRNRHFARWWLRFTAVLGIAGVGFHIFGVARNMGGWRNWSQNVLNGPPIPAPPSFTGLALAGLAALGLLEDNPND